MDAKVGTLQVKAEGFDFYKKTLSILLAASHKIHITSDEIQMLATHMTLGLEDRFTHKGCSILIETGVTTKSQVSQKNFMYSLESKGVLDRVSSNPLRFKLIDRYDIPQSNIHLKINIIYG